MNMGNLKPASFRIAAGILLSLMALGVYSRWVLEDLPKQGLHYDVALFGVRMMNFYPGLDAMDRRLMTIGSRTYPLMCNDYNGAVECYLGAWPGMLLMGHSAFALNAMSVFWGYIQLIVMGAAGAVFFGSFWAMPVILALLGSSPSYVAFSRIGLYAGTVHGALFSFSLLFFFLYWKQRRGPGWLVASAASMGLALGSRILMLWYLTALGITALGVTGLRQRLLGLRKRDVAAVLAVFIPGPFLVLLANARHDWFTLKFMTQFFFHSRGGVSNLAYLANIRERLHEYCTLWNASAWTNVSEANPLVPVLFLAALLWLVWGYFHQKREQGTPFVELFWAPLFCVVVLLLSPVTPTFLDVHHLSPLFLPSVLIVIAPLFVSLPRPWLLPVRVAFGLLLALYAGWNLHYYRVYHPHRNLHGGIQVRWDVMGQAVEWMHQQKIQRVGLGDTGLQDPLDFQSGRMIMSEEVFVAPYMTDVRQADHEKHLRSRFRREKQGYYLFFDPLWQRVSYRVRFMDIAQSEGKTVRRIHRVDSPEQEPAFVVYQVAESEERRPRR
ncbi:MAG TPA: hypothetical protein PK876_00925 [Elusimicrobiota bacterium]|nr:hypothetical protein [Elusimicrobiota bacterium]